MTGTVHRRSMSAVGRTLQRLAERLDRTRTSDIERLQDMVVEMCLRIAAAYIDGDKTRIDECVAVLRSRLRLLDNVSVSESRGYHGK